MEERDSGGCRRRQLWPLKRVWKNGYGTITAPGNDPLVLTVGATKSNGSTSAAAETLASYSSKGPTTYDLVVKPDMMAPGNDVVSLAAPGATSEAEYPANW